MRRFTRLTNGFQKIENHGHAVALHFLRFNFVRVHKTLRVRPAMDFGLADRVWTMEELVGPLDPVQFKNAPHDLRGDKVFLPPKGCGRPPLPIRVSPQTGEDHPFTNALGPLEGLQRWQRNSYTLAPLPASTSPRRTHKHTRRQLLGWIPQRARSAMAGPVPLSFKLHHYRYFSCGAAHPERRRWLAFAGWNASALRRGGAMAVQVGAEAKLFAGQAPSSPRPDPLTAATSCVPWRSR